MCPLTSEAVCRFQLERGLRVTGECDEHTWTALVEATWKLGDRMLVLTSPNLRGDDVADLQTRLGRIGFDCGRVDGIFGPRTAHAVEEFQSNCGVTADGLCGHDTIRVLARVSRQTGTGPGIASVREHEQLLQRPTSVASLRVVVGQFGGLSIISRSISHVLRQHGAQVMPLDEPDAIAQAGAANQFGADVYIGLEGSTDSFTVVHFYKVPSFESVGGRALATCLTTSLTSCDLELAAPNGMRLPVLRETKMPAVLCRMGPVRTAVDLAPQITAAVSAALASWTSHRTLDV